MRVLFFRFFIAIHLPRGAITLVGLLTALLISPIATAELSWPLRCPDGSERQCLISVSYPDVDGDGHDAACGIASDRGHTGTDMMPTEDAVAAGVSVIAAAAGSVIFVQDSMFDQCPADHPQCRPASRRQIRPDFSAGYTTCTPQGQYCTDAESACFWCFSGNYVVLEHEDTFTAYLHLKQGSVNVAPGQTVEAGDPLGLIASSGNSDGPHLHFEVWRGGFFKPVDPWQGDCGESDAPWVR